MADSTGYPDVSRQFAHEKGVVGYDILASKHPDRTVGSIADQAARIAMIASGRFDVDPKLVAREIIDSVTTDFPNLDEGTKE